MEIKKIEKKMLKKKKLEKKKSDYKKVEYREQTKGLVIVYTGEGKGKTTASLGLALRAAGYKKKVLIVQFGKYWYTGELDGIKKLSPYVKLIQGGKGFVKILNDKLPIEEHLKAAQDAYQKIYSEMISGKWDVIIGDEIIGAIAGKMLEEKQVLKLIKDKPEKVDLVLTGHHATQKVLDASDMATEMVAIKHPFEKGFLAKVGIDY